MNLSAIVRDSLQANKTILNGILLTSIKTWYLELAHRLEHCIDMIMKVYKLKHPYEVPKNPFPGSSIHFSINPQRFKISVQNFHTFDLHYSETQIVGKKKSIAYNWISPENASLFEWKKGNLPKSNLHYLKENIIIRPTRPPSTRFCHFNTSA